MNTVQDLLSYISDAHKDLYGFRPSYLYSTLSEMSVEELESLADEYSDSVSNLINEERRIEDENAKNFEDTLKVFMDLGAKDRMTALRWFFQTEEFSSYEVNLEENHVSSYVNFKLGLSYYYNILDGKMYE
jgi:hypothetical protein